jgi:hypothetical protein
VAPTSGLISRLPGWAPVDEIRNWAALHRSGKSAHKLIEIANSVEAVQDGRIYIELINWPFLSEHKGSPAE